MEQNAKKHSYLRELFTVQWSSRLRWHEYPGGCREVECPYSSETWSLHWPIGACPDFGFLSLATLPLDVPACFYQIGYDPSHWIRLILTKFKFSIFNNNFLLRQLFFIVLFIDIFLYSKRLNISQHFLTYSPTLTSLVYLFQISVQILIKQSVSFES